MTDLPLNEYWVSLPVMYALEERGGVSWIIESERTLMQDSSSSSLGRTLQYTSTGSRFSVLLARGRSGVLAGRAGVLKPPSPPGVRAGVLARVGRIMICF